MGDIDTAVVCLLCGRPQMTCIGSLSGTLSHYVTDNNSETIICTGLLSEKPLVLLSLSVSLSLSLSLSLLRVFLNNFTIQ